ncbi:glycyl-radical enzyme activating protein [Eubacteriaceae bacterium ES3]|nr:glycyl-radical enzyme activating protein [Eubacteriaceae bacterium ES3]
MVVETIGRVFNIQRYTVHDGPGIRTEFFLKGCPLRCKWCGNPESYLRKKQIAFYKNQCLGVSKCGGCVEVCPQNALIIEDDKVISIDRNLCDDCLKCYDECPSSALKVWGTDMTVEEAMAIIRKDKDYFSKNGGGVTVSGGEALLQSDFVKALFAKCQEEGIHTCLETALHVDAKELDKIMPYTDMVITDIKHINSEVHKKFIGTGNELVLSNIKKLAAFDKPIVLRIPVIPGFNDNLEDIKEIGEFIIDEIDNKVVQLQMLRFRPLGQEKYEGLQMPYKMEVTKERANFEAEIREYVKVLKDMGIMAYAGASNKIAFQLKNII